LTLGSVALVAPGLRPIGFRDNEEDATDGRETLVRVPDEKDRSRCVRLVSGLAALTLPDLDARFGEALIRCELALLAGLAETARLRCEDARVTDLDDLAGFAKLRVPRGADLDMELRLLGLAERARALGARCGLDRDGFACTRELPDRALLGEPASAWLHSPATTAAARTKTQIRRVEDDLIANLLTGQNKSLRLIPTIVNCCL
jgi:hypothetical protein